MPSRTVRLGELLRPKRAPTPDEATAIAEVHELVAEWSAGRLPVEEVAKLSTGRRRWLATRFTPPDHPLFRPLMALLDELIPLLAVTAPSDSPTKGPVFATPFGPVHEDQLRELEATIEGDDGRELIVWPYRYTWTRKPDPEKGIEGVRGPALYRPKDKRGPIRSTFSVAPNAARHAEKPDDGTPWWDRD